MSDTIREKIIAAICTALEDIRTANGYVTECGQTVKRGIRLVDQDQLPGLAVFPLVEDRELEAGKYNRHELNMRIRIDAVAKHGSENPSVIAEKMLGDVIYRMTNRDLTAVHGGYATGNVHYEQGGSEDYPDSGQYTIATSAVFKINYKTGLGDPFSQT